MSDARTTDPETTPRSLVHRLRATGGKGQGGQTKAEAAAEIERLQAEITRLTFSADELDLLEAGLSWLQNECNLSEADYALWSTLISSYSLNGRNTSRARINGGGMSERDTTQATRIVRELYALAGNSNPAPWTNALARASAVEIERLRSEVARLTANAGAAYLAGMEAAASHLEGWEVEDERDMAEECAAAIRAKAGTL